MMTYDVDLFLKLAQTFPAALNTSRVYESFEDRPGPWGMERISKGYKRENLGEDILTTATAICRTYGKDRALAYIDEFAPAKVQKAELLNFNRRKH